MSKTTAKHINKVASLAQKVAIGIVNILEMVILDAVTPKRRRSYRR